MATRDDTPHAGTGRFGPIAYEQTHYLAETMMSEIRYADFDGGPLVVKLALVDQEWLAAKLRLGEGQQTDPEAIRRFVAQKRPDFQQWLAANRQAIVKRVDANQAAIVNEAERWLDLQAPGHPGIVRLLPLPDQRAGAAPRYYQQSTLPGNPYFLLTEYLAGGTLREWMRSEKTLTVDQSLELVATIADVLEYVHGNGFVHLDVKPQNIVFRAQPAPGASIAQLQPVLIDFGISSKENGAGAGSASQRWAEPQRWQSSRALLVHRGMDIYSLGLVLRYVLSGEFPGRPAERGTPPLPPYSTPLDPQQLRFGRQVSEADRAKIAERLEDLVQHCLADRPEERPSARAVQETARQIRATVQRVSTPRIPGRRRLLAGGLIGIALLVLALLAGSALLGGRTPVPSEGGTPATASADAAAVSETAEVDTETSLGFDAGAGGDTSAGKGSAAGANANMEPGSTAAVTGGAGAGGSTAVDASANGGRTAEPQADGAGGSNKDNLPGAAEPTDGAATLMPAAAEQATAEQATAEQATAEQATATTPATDTPTATLQPTAALNASVIKTPSATPIPTPRSASTAAPARERPTSTAVPAKTATVLVTPTVLATRRTPTSTPLPPRVPPTLRPRSVSALTPAQLSAATVSGISWDAGQFCGAGWQGRATFSWNVNPDFKLPEGYAYQLVIWTPNKNQNPMTVPGYIGAVTGTSLAVNPDGFSSNYNFDLQHQIAVALVVNVPGKGYQRVKIMGPNNCMFRFTGGNN